MKSTDIAIAAAVILAASGLTSCYDDSGLKERIENVEGRVQSIEERINAINTDIDSLRQLIASLSGGAVITAVEETPDGYRLTLSNGRVINVNHGRDGKDGLDGKDAPIIGVGEENGVYYWTITVDGSTSWLTDANGNNLPVSGQKGDKGDQGNPGQAGNDGQEGKTPVIGVKDGYWTVDYGNGPRFVLDSDGEKVCAVPKNPGSGIFESVEPEEDGIVFTLPSGESFSVPRVDNFGLTIDTSNPYFRKGETRVYEMALTGVSDIYVSKASEGWTASIDGNRLTVAAPPEADTGDKGDIRVIVVNRRHDVRAFRISLEIASDIRVLTFEDADYRGSGNMLGRKDWSSLIDSPQYNGPLLYPNSEENVYNWHDEGNTELASRLVNAYGDGNFWTGGMAVSDYVDTDLGNGDFNHQLAVFSRDGNGNGGHNGSRNFCVQNGYKDTDPSGLGYNNKLPELYFHDGKARVVKSIWVNVTTYFANVWKNGNGLSEPGGEAVFKIVVYAFDASGNEIASHPSFTLADGSDMISGWQEFDLSSLGKVSKLSFNLECSTNNGYGMSLPSYFAFDDVSVVFD